jgi:hypothetical protein
MDVQSDAETMAQAAKGQLVASLAEAGHSERLGEQLLLVAQGMEGEAALLADPAMVAAHVSALELRLALLRDPSAVDAHRRAMLEAAGLLRRDAAQAGG